MGFLVALFHFILSLGVLFEQHECFVACIVTRFKNLNCDKITTLRSSVATSDVKEIEIKLMHSINRKDFPVLSVEAYPNKQLIYLDSAASSQKPLYVLDKMDEYYRTTHSNVHRGAHALANKATSLYESARESVQRFVNAQHREEIVFTRGATDAINIIAQAYSLPSAMQLLPGDEIVLSTMEHHSNLVPWQMTAAKTGAVLKFARLTEDMRLDVDHLRSLLTSRTKIVAVSHASNVLGITNPVRDIVRAAHAVGAVVLLDSCQAVPHMPVDVQDLEVDFLVASSHKMCGPTGIGFLYGRRDLLNQLPPAVGGGEMIDTVTLHSSTYALSPSRFEAGTPPIAEAVGLGAACEYLSGIGMKNVQLHGEALGKYLYEELQKVDGLELYGPSTSTPGVTRTSLVAFNSKAVHATDLAFFLDQEGVAVRTGHHCTQPLHSLLKVPGSLRASMYIYNDQADIDQFIEKLKDTLNMFQNL